LGGGGKVKALLLRRNGAENVLEHVVGFLFQWHTTCG